MKTKKPFFAVLGLLLAASAVVAVGEMDRDVSLESVGTMWWEILHDADQAALKVVPVRVSLRDEIRIGDDLARALQGQ